MFPFSRPGLLQLSGLIGNALLDAAFWSSTYACIHLHVCMHTCMYIHIHKCISLLLGGFLDPGFIEGVCKGPPAVGVHSPLETGVLWLQGCEVYRMQFGFSVTVCGSRLTGSSWLQA